MEERCECSTAQHCPLHPCKCASCLKGGRAAPLCKWRATTKKFVNTPTVKKEALDHLKRWRVVKKDVTIKRVPSYFDLAARAGISTKLLTRPRERVLLNVLAARTMLINPKLAVDISQCVTRQRLLHNGIVPTLGAGCNRVYLPAFGAYLTPEQCMCLHGVDVKQLKFGDISEQERFNMAGNAMVLPVVGAVIVAMLSVLG